MKKVKKPTNSAFEIHFIMDRKEKRFESEEQQKMRFQIELEFVQCLANPNYLNFLAQRGYFKDQNFINYLKYLLYWKDPKYAKFLKYPQCLHMLELLQYEHFRKELVNSQCAKFIDDQQLLHWQHYQRKRCALLQEQAEKTQAAKDAKESKQISSLSGT
ncbi:Mediator of RNA polymerase II transcription subunit 31-A [Bulinus truncatus]|nr:Mediator of RNA polymerase II transcription subunit 31-A [Bulinus truncatus]